MTLFDERERAFENLYAHDEELRFLAIARRNRLFAEWAAEQIGFRGREYHAYLHSFVDCAVLPNCDGALIARVREDFLASGVDASDERIRVALVQAGARAGRELRGDDSPGPFGFPAKDIEGHRARLPQR
jgi:hypothetical protein